MQRLFQGYSGVVERHVDTGIMLRNLIDKRLDVAFPSNVGADVNSFSTPRANLPLNFVAKVLATAAEPNLTAFRGEGKGCGTADSRSRSRNQNRLALETSPRRRSGYGGMGMTARGKRAGHGCCCESEHCPAADRLNASSRSLSFSMFKCRD